MDSPAEPSTKKKFISRVFPGVLLVFTMLLPKRAFIRLDLPEFERPKNATCGMPSLGTCFMEVAPSTKLTADICIIRETRKCYITTMRNVLLFCSLLIFACGDYAMMIRGDEQELYQNYKLLQAYFYHPERIKEFNEYSGMEVDTMYESLKDYFCGAGYEGECRARYTFYLPPEDFEDAVHNIENTKKYYSFGFERVSNQSEDTMIVSAVYPSSPAASGGLRKKDRLLFANDIPLTGEDLDTAYLRTDDKFKATTVFKVLRDGKIETLSEMKKEEVPKPTVYLDSIEGIPYIRVTEFKVSSNNPDGTYAEFKNYLQEINGARSAILDLRGNGGGNIGHCTNMVSEMVPANKELLYDEEHYHDKNRGNVVEKQHAYAKGGDGVNIRWIVLINHGSASCSERLLAALKYNRPETVVIGQTSYGKGIGQVYTQTYAGGLAYITCLQSYYPDGTTFHNIGIIPDIPTEPDDIETLRNAAIGAAQDGFHLAKRSSMSARSGTFPPERLADNPMPGAYKRIETPLFH